MKTFKQIISEVAEPLGGDEKRFKAKHVVKLINHPKGEEEQFTAKNIKKDKSKISGYKSGEDEAVYEEKMMTCDDCGEEYKASGECDCEDDEDEDEEDDLDEATLTDLENKRKEHIVSGMKKSEADLKARYGDKWKSLMYATATKNALYDEVELDEISKNLKKSYLAKAKDDVADRKKTISQANKMKNASRRNFHSHSLWMDVAYKNQDKNDSRKAMMAKAKDSMKVKKEEVELDEAFKAGKMKLNDGSSVTLTNESSNALNNLFNQLTSTNKTKMEQKLMSGSNGFNEILAFAKEV